MAAYYNELDPHAAAWLRELIKGGLIADGEVDERSIVDVQAADLRRFTQCHFFAGIGGWSYALRLAGWDDNRPVWTGSPPCQPFSNAGERKAQADIRHLWPVFFDLVKKCKPAILFGEQVEAAIKSSWLDDVYDDLESQDYATAAVVLPSCSVGAPHIRQRLWIVAERVADTDNEGRERRISGRQDEKREAIDRYSGRCSPTSPWSDPDWLCCRDGKKRPVESSTFPLANGISGRVGLLRGYGNAIVPEVAAEVIKAYMR